MLKLINNNINIKKITYLISLFSVFCFLFFVATANAQITSIGIANYLEINSAKVEDGDIIVTSEKGYMVSEKEYDPKIIGVVTTNPAISLKTTGTKDGFPVISQGTAIVKVTDLGGNIKKGDAITTSTVPGTGMKSTKTGFVLGEAAENINFQKKGETQLLTISINPHHVQSGSTANSVMDIFKLGGVAANEKPSAALKYIVATLIIIITFGSGFLIFAKSVNTGLEALGRNPLAGKQIQLSIVFNIIMIIVIIVVGTGLAYLVIRL